MENAIIERLEFGALAPHEPLEAAIHVARYALARPLCRGRRVLDAACGAGYGSRLLSAWGAQSVAGVDVASDAISGANALFASEAVKFHQHSVERLDELFAPGEFQLGVSLETLEHVSDPVAFLEGLRRVVAEDGALIISCPNDHWYYPSPGQGNPHHKRRYTFAEFKALAEGVLGPASGYLLGTMVSGFGNVPVDASATIGARSKRDALFESADASLLLVPSAEAISAGRSAYYVGCWGVPGGLGALASAAAYPLSMDSSPLVALRREIAMGNELAALRGEVMKLRADLDEARRAAARCELRERTLQAENYVMRDSLQVLQGDLQAIEAERAAHSCFETLEEKVTRPLPAPAARAVSWASDRARTVARRLLPR